MSKVSWFAPITIVSPKFRCEGIFRFDPERAQTRCSLVVQGYEGEKENYSDPLFIELDNAGLSPFPSKDSRQKMLLITITGKGTNTIYSDGPYEERFYVLTLVISGERIFAAQFWDSEGVFLCPGEELEVKLGEKKTFSK